MPKFKWNDGMMEATLNEKESREKVEVKAKVEGK